MLTIRLQRVGRRHDPAHRVVVQESSQSPKSGRFVEVLGSYNPRKEGHTIDAERASYWVSQGAQVSPTVHNLFVDLGVVKSSKVNPLPRKSPIEKEASEDEAETAAETSGEEETTASESTAESTDTQESPEDSAEKAESESSEQEEAADSSEQEEETAEQTS